MKSLIVAFALCGAMSFSSGAQTAPSAATAPISVVAPSSAGALTLISRGQPDQFHALKIGRLTKRLDQIDRRLSRLERDMGISIETLALFVRFWLTTTPALPEPAAQAARATAAERYDAFVAALGKRLSAGRTLQHEVADDLTSGPRAGTHNH